MSQMQLDKQILQFEIERRESCSRIVSYYCINIEEIHQTIFIINEPI